MIRTSCLRVCWQYMTRTHQIAGRRLHGQLAVESQLRMWRGTTTSCRRTCRILNLQEAVQDPTAAALVVAVATAVHVARPMMTRGRRGTSNRSECGLGRAPRAWSINYWCFTKMMLPMLFRGLHPSLCVYKYHLCLPLSKKNIIFEVWCKRQLSIVDKYTQ